MKREVLAMFGAAAIALAVFTASAGAATIVVTGTADEIENGGICSLREAVIASNRDAPFAGCNGDIVNPDTIVLQGGSTYTLDRHGVDDDTGVPNVVTGLGDLDIAGEVAIEATGGGLATIDGDTNGVFDADLDRVIDVMPTAVGVTLSRVRIFDGLEHSGTGGGGIRTAGTLAVVDSEVVGNQIAQSAPAQNTWGGGIFVQRGSLTLTRSTVAANRVDDSNAESAVGGGVMVDGEAGGATFTATNSTISNNTAIENVGANDDAQGGGLYNRFGTTTLTNVTISGNSATGRVGAGEGGGIYKLSGSVTMSGTIVAGNAATSTHNDCYGAVTSGGGNLIADPGPMFGCPIAGANDLTGSSAGLGPLAANGGLTATQALLPGSPAIDRGGSCPATDQRGVPRPQGAACDAGAFELQPPPVTPPAPVAGVAPLASVAGPTGLRAAALKKCKKKPKGPKRRKCKRKANRLPI